MFITIIFNYFLRSEKKRVAVHQYLLKNLSVDCIKHVLKIILSTFIDI